MASIEDQIPDIDVLLELAPEEVAFHLLKVARTHVQNGIFHPNTITELQQPIGGGNGKGYDPRRYPEANVALKEAWHWIEMNMLVIPAPGINGSNGHRQFSRRGAALVNQDQFNALRRSAAFPKELLHPKIAARVWISLARSEFDTAVIFAFRTVEEAVRAAGNFPATEIGTQLMRKAFDAQNGPLTEKSQPVAEREALANLFAGAIGSYKNPHSHRTVTISDHTEAQEVVMLASHLLRIVDARVPAQTPKPSATGFQRVVKTV